MRFFLKRTLLLIATLWVAVTLNFLIPRLMPGNPGQAMIAKFTGEGHPLNPAALHSIDIMLGISHASLLTQYWNYLGEVVHLNFGMSFSYFPYTVAQLIERALPWTLGLVGIATIISFALGTALGVIAAWGRNTTTDGLLTTIAAFLNTFPYFWFALVAVYIMGFILHWFPLSGGYTPGATPVFSLGFITDVIRHGVLPALTIVVSSVGGWLIGMRNNMINTLGEDYVLLAQAKGLKSRWIATMYAAHNAILPNITGFGMALGFVVAGSLLTEVVFGYPGMGNLLYNAVINEDYPLMQGIFLVIVTCVVVANFIVDLLYVLIDPRVRYGEERD
ncbi:MAG: peptide ABC transporter permease [Sulfobacillus benefaciens]|uniref:Peptide ABC transporter permease n=1 Tax=Sulfobacillus benefaciens TaxID=453960 RepID=A0A2T2X542_9FIRM|nr:MAG: peptide ABC transporter permease [Sulfobacillus benefaciens]